MEINEFQKQAMLIKNKDIKGQDMLINGVMGLCGEAGEVIDLVKKHLHQGHELSKEKVEYELGDVLWYVAEIASYFDINMSDILQMNVDKLHKRYPQGFEVEKSIERSKDDN